MPTKIVRECSAEGCEREVWARGLCNRHCSAGYKDGSLKILTAEDRFWGKVDKSGPIPERHPDLGSCWVWLGEMNNQGYPITYDGRSVLAHRWSYEFHVGPIPEGYVIDHLCVVPICVNPSHLEAVTMRENTLRGDSVAGINARKTHCIRGHEFTLENTHLSPKGHRSCRACKRERRERMEAIRVSRKPSPQGE